MDQTLAMPVSYGSVIPAAALMTTSFALMALTTSPVIDAGTDASSVTSQDLDGDSRPTGPGYDMGSDEQAASNPEIVAWRQM